MRALASVSVVFWALSASGAKPAAPTDTFFIELRGVEAAANAPANVAEKTKKLFADIVAKRADMLTELRGAPERTDVPAFKAYLKRRHIHAYAVTVKLPRYERSLETNDKPGRTGQILTISVEVSLIGTSIPEDILAISVSGGATVKAETGSQMLPREEESALDEALGEALSHGLDDAVTKLRKRK